MEFQCIVKEWSIILKETSQNQKRKGSIKLAWKLGEI